MDRLSFDLFTTALCSGALYSPLLNICIFQLNYPTAHLTINSLEHNSKKKSSIIIYYNLNKLLKYPHFPFSSVDMKYFTHMNT